jgi:hypothetical protein
MQTWTKKNYSVKLCIRLVLNKLNVMKNYIFIYNLWASTSKKFIKKLPIYMWPMFTHVRQSVNYEWIKDSTESELKFNYKCTKS